MQQILSKIISCSWLVAAGIASKGFSEKATHVIRKKSFQDGLCHWLHIRLLGTQFPFNPSPELWGGWAKYSLTSLPSVSFCDSRIFWGATNCSCKAGCKDFPGSVTLNLQDTIKLWKPRHRDVAAGTLGKVKTHLQDPSRCWEGHGFLNRDICWDSGLPFLL